MESIPEEIEEFIPDFKMILKDFSPSGKKEVMGQVFLKIFLYITMHIFDENIMDILRLIFSLFKESEDEHMKSVFLVTVLRYIMSNRSDIRVEDLEEIVSNLLPEGGDVILTLAEQLINEGERRGERRGEKRGEKNELLDTIAEFIIIHHREKIKRLPDDISAKLMGKRASDLRRIRNHLFEGRITSLEQLRDLL